MILGISFNKAVDRFTTICWYKSFG